LGRKRSGKRAVEAPAGRDPVEVARRALAKAAARAAAVDLAWIRPLPPPDGWPLAPDVLRFLAALVRVLRPRHVIEFGSGLSTRALARACAGREPTCAISSADHDPDYSRAARAAVRADAAGARVRLQIAPVVARDCGGELLPVYALSAARMASRRPADLALIDGPPDLLGGREGTLYQVLDLARPGTIVLLDDAAREHEQEALRHWKENLGPAIEADVLPGFAKGLAAIIVREAVARSQLWRHRAALTASELKERVPAGATLILADDNRWGAGLVPGRKVLPFTERDGEYWGPPASDAEGIRKLEELRARGARHFAVVWPAFWWLEHYARLAAHLRDRYRCTLDNRRVRLFRL
jgi:predicted O-methyltransferase YrrM